MGGSDERLWTVKPREEGSNGGGEDRNPILDGPRGLRVWSACGLSSHDPERRVKMGAGDERLWTVKPREEGSNGGGEDRNPILDGPRGLGV